MLLSTTPTFENNPIKEYKGVVTGETIIGANALKDLKASITDFFGGRSGSYEREMTERAAQLGANAIVGIDFDYETIGANGSMLMVACSGTAVLI